MLVTKTRHYSHEAGWELPHSKNCHLPSKRSRMKFSKPKCHVLCIDSVIERNIRIQIRKYCGVRHPVWRSVICHQRETLFHETRSPLIGTEVRNAQQKELFSHMAQWAIRKPKCDELSFSLFYQRYKSCTLHDHSTCCNINRVEAFNEPRNVAKCQGT